MLTEEQLAELEAAEAKATQNGEWRMQIHPEKGATVWEKREGGSMQIAEIGHAEFDYANAKFIALARNNLKALIDEVRKWRKQFAIREGALDNLKAIQEGIDAGLKEVGGIVKFRDENQTLRAQLEIAYRLLRDTEHALTRLKTGVNWADNHEWFEDVHNKAREALAKIESGGWK